jgi:hypothetical protein
MTTTAIRTVTVEIDPRKPLATYAGLRAVFTTADGTQLIGRTEIGAGHVTADHLIIRFDRDMGYAHTGDVTVDVVVDVDTPAIADAVTARDLYRTAKRAAVEHAAAMEAKGDRRRMHQARRLVELSEQELDSASADVERAVRAANPGVPEAAIQTVAREL